MSADLLVERERSAGLALDRRALLETFRLRLATPRDEMAVDRLRQRAYATAVNFTLHEPGALRTRNDPPGSVVLMLTSGDTLAATVRLNVVASRARASLELEADASVPADWFPGLIIGRGATDPTFRGLGSMAFLVSLGVAAARDAGQNCAIATQYEGAPHFNAMRRAGWQRKSVGSERMARTLAKSIGPLNLVYIRDALFADSVAHSAQVHADIRRVVRASSIEREVGAALEKAKTATG
ncbi:MAG: hypothetical protein AB7P21_22605 [Lautropia sp.]